MGEGAQRALRIAAIIFFLSLVVFAKFHEPTRFVHTLQKLAHPVTFGAVALLLLTLLKRQTPRRFGSYAVAFALTVLCGAGTEIAQAFVHRDPSLLDVLRDALGASTALAGFATLVPGEDARGRGRWRVTGALLAIVGFVIMVAPISISLAAYARRDLSFPMLLEACSPLDLYFVSGGGADVSVVPSTGQATSRCGSTLRVTFGSAPYAGIALEEPYPDWRMAHTLVLDLRNPGDLDLPLAQSPVSGSLQPRIHAARPREPRARHSDRRDRGRPRRSADRSLADRRSHRVPRSRNDSGNFRSGTHSAATLTTSPPLPVRQQGE
jgi:VanZ family protein